MAILETTCASVCHSILQSGRNGFGVPERTGNLVRGFFGVPEHAHMDNDHKAIIIITTTTTIVTNDDD